MADLYHTSPMGAGGESHVLVVHCSDPRYQPHFQEFLHQGLGVDRYALVAVPGGPQALAPDDLAPKFGWAAGRWLKFMHQIANTNRVILIAHGECRWYENRMMGLAGESVRQRQCADLRHVRAALVERYGGKLTVETYYGAFAGDGVRFEVVQGNI
jgi:hypothetical protein